MKPMPIVCFGFGLIGLAACAPVAEQMLPVAEVSAAPVRDGPFARFAAGAQERLAREFGRHDDEPHEPQIYIGPPTPLHDRPGGEAERP